MRKMGFGVRWLGWMEALAFNSSISILVNGSPTKDFKVSRGLHQRNPLSAFLLVFDCRGLSKINAKNGIVWRLWRFPSL